MVKVSSFDNFSVVGARRVQYDVLNNTLYPTSTNLLTTGSTMSIPSNLILSAITSGDGGQYFVPLTFGNGIFKSGNLGKWCME